MRNHCLIIFKKALAIVLILSTIIITVRVSDVAANGIVSPQKAYNMLINKGLTCEVQAILLALDDDQRSALGRLAYDKISKTEIMALIESRDKNCSAPGDMTQNETSSIAIASPMITTSYTVEMIEEATGSGGYYPSTIFRDSSSSGWMCNSGKSETPADYVAQFNVPKSYSNLSRLRIRGTNSFASCYIKNPTAARVYSDNSIRACYGYWEVFFCVLAHKPATYESVIWVQ